LIDKLKQPATAGGSDSTMRTIKTDLENILAAGDSIPEDTPVFMLNLLRYRENADYGERADVAPCSGREAYHERYAPVTSRIIAADGAKVFWHGSVVANLIALVDERWDEVLLVEYPNFAAFRRLLENPKYQTEAIFHRMAALADSRLIATVKMA